MLAKIKRISKELWNKVAGSACFGGARSLECIEIIDAEVNFIKDIDARVKRWGSGHNMVTVLSPVIPHLLDQLFCTDFNEHCPTTSDRALWFAMLTAQVVTIPTANVRLFGAENVGFLIMDVSGSASTHQEHKGEALIRNTTLLSLALSDIAIISLLDEEWSNIDQHLWTIFEAMFGLFGEKAAKKNSRAVRTLLLFFIPSGEYHDIALFQNSITSKCKRIWQRHVQKSGFWDCQYSDLFDFAFTTITNANQDLDLAKLQLQFKDKNDKGYLFKPEYCKPIPVNKLVPYMESVWEYLNENKHCHLPTQDDLLSQFYFPTIKHEVPPHKLRTVAQSAEWRLNAIPIDPVTTEDVPARGRPVETLEDAPFNVLLNFGTQGEPLRRHSLVDSFTSLSQSNEILVDFSMVGMTRTAEVQTVHIDAGVQTTDQVPDLQFTLESLLAILTTQKAKTSVNSLVNPVTIDLTQELLCMKNYLNIASEVNNISDAKTFIDFLLCLLDNDHLSPKHSDVLDVSHRARRLMYKMASKMPIIPRSLIIHGVKVNHNCVSWGGFADIFKGEFQGAPVALKLLRDAKHNNLYREALTWRSLRHDNVLSFLGICKEGGVSFLVSPFMEGGTLAEWRRKLDRNPPVAEIQNNILQVAHGLQYIHSQGIVHGDIRGSNVLIDPELRPKIADFGLTRHLDATGTQSNTLSPNFAAPELFGYFEDDDDFSDSEESDTQKLSRTQKSDVYAFACLYYEIHFDTVPFSETPYFQIMKKVTGKERAQRLDDPALGDHAWKLINRCWRHEAVRRPAMEGVVETMMEW